MDHIHLLAIRFLYGQQVLFRIGYDHLNVAVRLDTEVLASTLIKQHLANLIMSGPRTICAGHVGARSQHPHRMVGGSHNSQRLQLHPDRLIDFAA